jgi:phage tail protein X
MRLARCFSLGLALFGLAAPGCSLLVDHTSAQCETDDDCLRFGGRPFCQRGVCVPSGLGPEGCVIGTPKSQGDYLNACSTAACVPFDNCARLGLCTPDAAPPPGLDPMNPTIPPLVNPATTPTRLCSEAGPNRIYMFGTADFAPLLKAVQPLLSENSPPYRAIYLNATSCAGVTSVFDPAKRVVTNPAPGATPNYAFYFDDQGQRVSCLLDTDGNTVDVGVSNLYSTTCNTATAVYESGKGVSDYTGPVVPFALSVPSASSQVSISAEAAHLVFGRGGKGTGDVKDATPWTSPTFLFIRNSGAGSTVLTGLLIDVDKTKFWGIDRLSTDNLRDSMLASTAADQSMGILSMDYADKNRGNLRSLYLQARGQRCGYLPDSNKNSFDKMNVRDGHYPLWGYVHFFTPMGPGGVPSDAAKALVTRFSVARLEQRLVDNIIGASLVPQCAMKVVRTAEVGDFAPQAGFQCGCYFDLKTTGKTDCKPCQSSSDCPADRSACNYGYCEVN